jgi:DNA-directed RNA polymerase subunit RPC12/RpoP
MGKKEENTGFVCAGCGADVVMATNGGYRNHCPFCLCSVHIDVEPGDRASECLGIMKPVSARNNTQKGWQILHKCTVCGFERYNMVCDEGEQADNYELIMRLV